MTRPILTALSLIVAAVFATSAFSDSHVANPGGFGVIYGNDECNRDADFLTENGIVCTAVFSDTNVWDFLNNLPRRIDLDEMIALNPNFLIVEYDTIITGITFVRVQ